MNDPRNESREAFEAFASHAGSMTNWQVWNAATIWERERGNFSADCDRLRSDVAAVAAERDRYRAALLDCARQAERLKKPCGMDPEGYQAVRNGQYQNISTTAHVALGAIRGPNV